LFNDLPAGESITCEEIQARTNIPMHELTRNLQSLAVAPKTRVLIKEPMSKDVKPTDRFSFNEAFHSPFNKIKIGVVSSANRVEDLEERRETEKKNNDTRGGIIEAAIVRIMKYASNDALASWYETDAYITGNEKSSCIRNSWQKSFSS
jgi:cullin 3